MSRQEKKRLGITLGIIVPIIIVAALAYLAQYFGFIGPQPATATVPNADAAAQRFQGRSDLTDPDYLNKVAAAGLAKGEREGYIPAGAGVPDLNGGFTQTAPAPKPEVVAPVANGEWPVKEKWTIQTSRGTLTLVYRETDSAKDVSFRVENGKMIIKNKLNRPVRLVYFTKFNGEVNSSDTLWKANEENTIDLVASGETGNWEVWIVNRDR